MANKLFRFKKGNDRCYPEEIPYSTEEIRIGTWINGKSLYRKTVVFTAGGGEFITYSHGIQNVDTIWADMGHTFLRWSDGSRQPWLTKDDAVGFFVDKNYVNVTLFHAQEELFVTLLYTKTTD